MPRLTDAQRAKILLEQAQRYYEALRRISVYKNPEWIRDHGEKTWGLPPEECLEIAYGNVLLEARSVVRGKRRPK